MARIEPAAELPTLWRVPDDLWQEFILPLLQKYDPEPRMGRPRIDQRRALDGIIFVMRTGSQWNVLPREFGSDSSVHRTYQRWVQLGLFKRLWAGLAQYGRKLGMADFDWQSSDTSMGKARFRGIARAPVPPIAPSRAPNAAC
jgi:putative transposase